MSNITSPCILVCSIDDKTGYCFGCGRTSQEITAWITMGETGRLAIMATLAPRLETIERKPRRITRRKTLAQIRAAQNSASQST